MKIYQVGGAVRDKLLGLPVKDRDWVVVGATVQEMLDQGYQQVGRDFPVFLHPKSKEEYALARTERKSGKGYTGFEVHASPEVTLEEDLARRDLTINTIACDEDNNLIDPFNGQSDINAKMLRHVSPAFAEDPLRVLRVARFAARFAQKDFSIAPETLQLMSNITESGELEHLVAERIWQEMHKALCTDNPEVFFKVLLDCGALKVLMPEVFRLFGVPQPKKFHPEVDTGIHSLMVLKQATLLSIDPCVRFAALVHDLGKACTSPELWPSHKGHEESGAVEISALCERLRIPNEYRDLGKLVSLYHTRCHRAPSQNAEELFLTLELSDALRRPDRFESFLLACEADARGRLGLEEKPYPQAPLLSRVLKAVQLCKPADVILDGMTGEEIAKVLRKQKIQSIAKLLSSPE